MLDIILQFREFGRVRLAFFGEKRKTLGVVQIIGTILKNPDAGRDVLDRDTLDLDGLRRGVVRHGESEVPDLPHPGVLVAHGAA
ncbi:hypothetical protein [Streptomyces eurythermus]|uniref:hypothetical protein n=1 Tax=Streptomyces eurythermus TaxID=42237 RepID=UPI0033F16205